VPGYVQSPYTAADLKATLAEVSRDAAFADEFFARYIDGRDVIDYARLLARAGLILQPPDATARGFTVIPAEDAGQRPTEGQQRFRDAWLSSGARNIF
jgi:predicted metalloprotease with PDZ domain